MMVVAIITELMLFNIKLSHLLEMHQTLEICLRLMRGVARYQILQGEYLWVATHQLTLAVLLGLNI